MAALYASQAEGRAEKQAEADAAEADSRTTSTVAAEDSNAAIRVPRDAASQAEAGRAAAAKASDERRAKQAEEKDQNSFAPPASDSVARDAGTKDARTGTRPAPGFLSYEATLAAKPGPSGSTLDGRF